MDLSSYYQAIVCQTKINELAIFGIMKIQTDTMQLLLIFYFFLIYQINTR